MSDRPEDIPQWAVEEAMEIANLAQGGGISLWVDRCARAILKAREESFEEAAKIADDHWRLFGSKEIASAIRLHSQKGER